MTTMMVTQMKMIHSRWIIMNGWIVMEMAEETMQMSMMMMIIGQI